MYSGGVELFRLWVRKGSPFTLQVPNNPPIEHDGGTTAIHLALSPDQQKQLTEAVAAFGCDFNLIPHERQTEEQTKERQALLGLQNPERVWPSTSCLTCAWFDPLLEGEPCGRAGWDPEAITVFGSMEGPHKDAQACPVSYIWWDKGG